MKVFFDYSIFSAQKFGGISRYFVELARHLAQTSDVQPFVCAPVHINSYLPSLDSRLRSGVTVPEIRRTGILRDFVSRDVLPIAEFLSRPDIVHETFYRKPWLRTTKAKTCVTVYDMIDEKFSHLVPVGERALFEKNLKIKHECIKRADLIFCISENTQQDLMEICRVPRDKTRVTHLSANLPALNPRDENRIVARRPYILFVGQRGRYKNFDVVLKAFAMDKKISSEFELQCFGGGSFSASERERISKFGLEGKVHGQSGDDMTLAAAYRDARAFIYPSLYEGFGIPLLESMWADCPLIASSTSCFPEIADNAAAYFDPSSPEDCARVISEVAFDDERCRSLVDAGQVRRGQFNWSKTAEETRLGYKSLF